MKIMLIDDERLANMQLEMMLKQNYIDSIDEVRAFQLVSEALEEISSFVPDVVFLDIHMPEMSGLEVAERIHQINPQIEIVFVTAHDQFALQAFELNALDYLLKPLMLNRLEKTFSRIKNRINNSSSKLVNHSDKQKILCMNTIRFQLGSGDQIYPKWRTAKAQELFAYLIHRRGEYVSKDKIINMFTPEIDKKRGLTQLYTIVYQIRRCLKETGIELFIENNSIQESYCLKLEDTSLDFVEWEQKVKQLNKNISGFYEQLEDIVFSYEGHYMGEYDYVWADSERERLLQLWLLHAKMLVEHYEFTKEWTKLIKVVEKQFLFNPYEYNQVLPLLIAFSNLGQVDKIKHYYARYKKECYEELELPLPDEVVAWYENWEKIHLV